MAAGAAGLWALESGPVGFDRVQKNPMGSACKSYLAAQYDQVKLDVFPRYLVNCWLLNVFAGT